MSEETEDLYLPDRIRRRVSVDDLEQVVHQLQAMVTELRDLADVLEGKRLANADPQA